MRPPLTIHFELVSQDCLRMWQYGPKGEVLCITEGGLMCDKPWELFVFDLPGDLPDGTRVTHDYTDRPAARLSAGVVARHAVSEAKIVLRRQATEVTQ